MRAFFVFEVAMKNEPGGLALPSCEGHFRGPMARR